MNAKFNGRAYYEAIVVPNTEAASVAYDLMRRLGDPEQPMFVVAIWSRLPRETNTLGALIRYEANGANSNDIWRRICSAAPVTHAQVQVREVARVSRDRDTGLVATCLADVITT